MSTLTEMFKDLELVLSIGNVLKSRRVNARGFDPDDAKQEIRLAVLKSLQGYDFNRAEGELLPYLRTIARNTQNELYARSRRLHRNPHAKVEGENGSKISVLLGQADYDTVMDLVSIGDAGGDTLRELIERETRSELDGFLDELNALLSERERLVLGCRLNPPPELQEMMEEMGEDGQPSNVALAKFLGLRKNQVDWAWYKIRSAFTELASDECFSDVFGDDIGYQGWPAVHISKGTRFHEQFVLRTMRSRGLDLRRLSPPKRERSQLGARVIEEYSWGVVLCVEMEGEVWSAVLEGRFAPRTGELFGSSGARKMVPIEGYAKLARSLTERPVPGEIASEVAMRARTIYPSCVGQYEPGHTVCDGSKAEKPCASRDKCSALALRMRQKNTKPSAYVELKEDSQGQPYAVPKDVSKFDKITQGVISAFDIREGRPNRTAPPPSPRGQAATQAAAKAERQAELQSRAAQAQKGRRSVKPLPPVMAERAAAKARRKGEPVEKHRTKESLALDPWMKQWLQAIVEGLGREFNKDDDLATPGQLFLKDRRLTSGYVGLYCKRADGKEVAVAYLHYKPRTGRMDLKVPVEPGRFEGVSAATMKALKPVACVDGAWKSVCLGLDQMGVMLGAEAVLKLIHTGIIVLPPVPA